MGVRQNPFYAVEVCPDDTAERIREWLRDHPEIAKERYEAEAGSVSGHCYVASEAYFYANGGEDSGLDVYCLSWGDGSTHWYLRRPDIPVVYDLSVETVEEAHEIPHHEGTHRAFIGGYTPSKRAERINDALGLWS